MLRDNLIAFLDRFAARKYGLLKPAMAVALSMMLLGLNPAHAQHRKKDKEADTYYTIVVKYVGTGSAEVFISDAKQGQKEILHTTLRQGETARARAFATITRQTQSSPETDIRWKVSGRYDEKGIPLKPEDKQKPLTWCGDYQTSHNYTTVEIGFQGSVMGRSC